MKKKLMIIMTFLLISFLSGCSKKEDEIQYAPKDEVREDIFLDFEKTNTDCINHSGRMDMVYGLLSLNSYGVSVLTDSSNIYYDEAGHYVDFIMQGSNDTLCDLIITADVKINGSDSAVESVDFELKIEPEDKRDEIMRIYLSDKFDDLIENVQIRFKIESSDNLYVESEECIISGFTNSEYLSLVITEANNVTAQSDASLEGDTRLLLEQQEIERQNAEYEAEVAAEEEAEHKAFIGEGNKQVGNDRLGYIVIPMEYEEVSNETEKIVYRYEDEIGLCEISLYLDDMDMSETFPYATYTNNVCKRFLDAGGEIETGGGALIGKAYGVEYYMSRCIGEYGSEEIPLQIVGTTEDPNDSSKVIVFECSYSVNSMVNRDNGCMMITKYRHPYFGEIYGYWY